MSMVTDLIERNKDDKKEKKCECMECLKIKQEYKKLSELVKSLRLNPDVIFNLR